MEKPKINQAGILPETLELLRKISADKVMLKYRLVGGTAIAVLRGHRLSVDLDFFTNQDQDVKQVEELLNKYGVISALEVSADGGHVSVSVNNIKCDFVRYAYRWIKEALVLEDILVADLADIAAMKVSAIGQRGAKKDFFDLYELLNLYSIEEIIAFFRDKYRLDNDFHYLQALTYFADADKDLDPKLVTLPEWGVVKLGIISKVKSGLTIS